MFIDVLVVMSFSPIRGQICNGFEVHEQAVGTKSLGVLSAHLHLLLTRTVILIINEFMSKKRVCNSHSN